MNDLKRALLLVSICGIVLVFMIWDQSTEMTAVEKKITAREDRLEEAKNILTRNPQLIKNSGAKPSKADPRSLMAIFSQTLADRNLDQQIVSLTPSADKKKKLDKVRLQLRNLRLKQALSLVMDIKEQNPKISEIEVDLQIIRGQSWKLTGTWAMAQKL